MAAQVGVIAKPRPPRHGEGRRPEAIQRLALAFAAGLRRRSAPAFGSTSFAMTPGGAKDNRHREGCKPEAIQRRALAFLAGLLRFARNDMGRWIRNADERRHNNRHGEGRRPEAIQRLALAFAAGLRHFVRNDRTRRAQ
ncbi:hypothetical protein [Dichotomicrobium thermohalophilum]|uniref:hypothetical protein n=1 Tax=Dichotomicrobium thermohalophilum TaxID=933063 RepID=UPI0011C23132|nr:hypothetical protein [Dichotomicrobium thermohalophilum]